MRTYHDETFVDQSHLIEEYAMLQQLTGIVLINTTVQVVQASGRQQRDLVLLGGIQHMHHDVVIQVHAVRVDEAVKKNQSAPYTVAVG